MKLAKHENGSDWFIVSDIGRKYELATTIGIKSKSWYDIVVIFDFDDDHENDRHMTVVDFFYGASDFINRPESALGYIKNAITKYERNLGCTEDKFNIEIIKEF